MIYLMITMFTQLCFNYFFLFFISFLGPKNGVLVGMKMKNLLVIFLR